MVRKVALRAGCIALSMATGALGAAPNEPPAVHPETWPSPRWPVAVDPVAEGKIANLLKRMTPEEKVGQLLQADLASVTPADVKRYHLGSVLNGGNAGPYGDDHAPAPKWLQLADEFYNASTDTSGGGVGIPIIWGTDAVHGHSNIVGATLFPHNIGLGAAHDPDLIERIGAVTAEEIRVTGQEWTFAPTITVPQDYRWGRAYEGYSSDPKLVASYAGRMILGLQGKPNSGPILAGRHVIASTKHFIADGATFEGHDQGDARISEEQLRDVHGAPYVPAIEAGVATVMTSFSSWQGYKLSGNKGLITDVLKNRMNFGGFVVTDWNSHGQIPGCTNTNCAKAINAGVDMYMAPDSWKGLYATMLSQVRDGTIPMARLDDAVGRVLRVKFRLGLFEAGKPSQRPLAGQWGLLGSPEHRAVAREAVAKSLVLLKNDGVLPLKPAAHILVAGNGADDVARQSGGWTISWQGTGIPAREFKGATSLWSAFSAAAKAGGGSSEYAPDGRFKKKPDAAIVVFGETPYAEFQGDLKALQLRPELRKPLETMRRLKAAGIPVVAVMLTGRPLFTGAELNTADAFVVAWLPGSEGGGVADRLFGRPVAGNAAFTGTLPAAWPTDAKPGGAALFPRGYGLAGRDTKPWKPVNEESGVAEVDNNGVLLGAGVASWGWALRVGNDHETTPITATPLEALNGRIRVTAVDYQVQEGARLFDLAGGEPLQVLLESTDPVDLTRETNGEVMVVSTIRADTATPADATFGLDCGSRCSATVPLRRADLAVGRWTTLGVSLKCFVGAKMDKVMAPIVIRTALPFRFALARVALATSAEKVLTCP
jgi:beta-glucosidase